MFCLLSCTTVLVLDVISKLKHHRLPDSSKKNSLEALLCSTRQIISRFAYETRIAVNIVIEERQKESEAE